MSAMLPIPIAHGVFDIRILWYCPECNHFQDAAFVPLETQPGQHVSPATVKCKACKKRFRLSASTEGDDDDSAPVGA